MIRRPPRSTLFPYTTLFRSPSAVAELFAVVFAGPRRTWGDLGVLADSFPVVDPEIAQGTCFPIFAYEVAQAIDLDEAERRLFARSEEHTSELQSPCNLVCRL